MTALREAFLKQAAELDPHRLVFVDESGCRIGMTRDYGRAERGERVAGAKPASWGDNVTMIGALDLDGVRALMTVRRRDDGRGVRSLRGAGPWSTSQAR